MNENLPPPISDSNDGISIHLSYIRRDILDIKNTQTETNRRIEDIGRAFVTIGEFNEHLKADEDHEKRIRVLEAAMWKYVGFAGAIAAAVSLVGSIIANHYIK